MFVLHLSRLNCPNFGGLVPGCIEPGFCKQVLISFCRIFQISQFRTFLHLYIPYLDRAQVSDFSVTNSGALALPPSNLSLNVLRDDLLDFGDTGVLAKVGLAPGETETLQGVTSVTKLDLTPG